jgi:hypothetical protein
MFGNLFSRKKKKESTENEKRARLNTLGPVGELMGTDDLGEPGNIIWLDECEALGSQPHWMRFAMHHQRLRREAGLIDPTDDGRYCRPNCKNCGYTPRPEDAGYGPEAFVDDKRYFPDIKQS